MPLIEEPSAPGRRVGDPGRAAADAGNERLQKVLARAGFGSRRACEELIAAGRVTVNGDPASLGRRVDLSTDSVAVDGARVGGLPGLVHYLLNKPSGFVTTVDDPQRRHTVVELVPDEPRVFPVGRLDADSEGLLLMTNDGQLAQLLSHPSFGVEKEYLVKVAGAPSPGELARLRDGVELSDGVTAPAKVRVVGDRADGVLRISIHEGRNRQVRRMCEAVGHPVRRLVRVRIGPVRLRGLEPGQWRMLSSGEVHELELDARRRVPGPRPRPLRKGGRRLRGR